jgi:hypothetical protein
MQQHQQHQHAQHNNEHLVGQYALETLLHWTKTCRVSLAHFNTSLPMAAAATLNNNTVTVLPLLIHMLSSSSLQHQQQQVNNERILVLASNALTEAILIPDDDDNNGTRSLAVQTILQAIAHTTGFIAAPLHRVTTNGWEDATHALTVLLCTFFTEEVDECCCYYNNNGNNDANVHALLELLLQVQNHPNIKICCLVRVHSSATWREVSW